MASRALKVVTDLADKYGVTLTLYATNYTNRGLDVEDLIEWYSRHGFKAESEGWRRGVDMTRLPRKR